MSESDKATAWKRLARLTVLRFNTGWWFERLAPLLVAAGLTAAIAIIFLRARVEALDWVPVSASAGGLLLLCAIGAFFLARRRFISTSQALVRLESRLHLKNALTAAENGIAPWPSPPAEHRVQDGFAWHWPRLLAPFGIALLVVTISLAVPVTRVEGTSELPPSEPLAWEQMESWLETLEEEAVLEEDATKKFRDSIEALRERPEQEWFAHSSMEATDTLRDSLNHEIRQLATETSVAQRNLSALQAYSAQMSEAVKAQLGAEFSEALRNLQMNELSLNQDLMQALNSIDPSKLGQLDSLSSEQMKQLQEALKKLSDACKQCSGNQPGLGKGFSEDETALMKKILGSCNKPGAGNCNKPGQSGITRGPGTAPITMGEEQRLNTDNLEGVQNPDFSNALPADLMGLGVTEHEIDETLTGPTAAGALNSNGQGGEAIWRDSLLPEDKAVLKRYFK